MFKDLDVHAFTYFEFSSSPIVYFKCTPAVGRHLEIGLLQGVGHVFSFL